MEEGERSEKEIVHKSLVRRDRQASSSHSVTRCLFVGTGVSHLTHELAKLLRRCQQKNDNFARWGQKTAQSEKFKEKAEGKVEIQ